MANAGRGRSSWRLLAEAQRLQVGLRIGEEGFTVRSFEATKHLVLAYHYPQVEWELKEGLWPKFGECSLAFVLQPPTIGAHGCWSHQVHPGRARRPPSEEANSR